MNIPKEMRFWSTIVIAINILAFYPVSTAFSTNIDKNYYFAGECTDPKLCNDYQAKETDKKEFHFLSFLKWLNTKAYAMGTGRKEDSKEIIRQKWENFFGVDIFYPYFKAKKAEDWLENKGKFTLFKNIKGKPLIEGKDIKYIIHSDF